MLCSECIGYNQDKSKYFAQVGTYECQECGPVIKEALTLIGFLIILFLYVAMLVM